ncbi:MULTISPECIES: sugar phosphate isomerase/epimerase [unclassified Peribacillus]|uniref:sugar phosphate isomerase/epimerase family protein n=1 Tax=unclassified Peribacillus TaxID=2675266 RepID=UPI001911DEF7|nr:MULTISPECIES: sugar phosphate isomerase/epimerase family protein [unclassified Peribacillus]MBK5445077.1 sugar phosphate isomerase/epimerase [Peribacillus sp. TH24]WMX56496.1 sugar phosphate isomerase/epimerase family protein [Peribacillus sp. R9-11]
MNPNLMISGFSDEISSDFDIQLDTVSQLGMKFISLRGIDGKSIGDFTVEEIKETVLPKLQNAGIGVSSIGSPIGKVFINDEAGFVKQKRMLEVLCQISRLLDCGYIRIFSFYIPKDEDPDQFGEDVIRKLTEFAAIAEKYDVILLHENEKDIYGDVGRRCTEILRKVASPYFKAIFDFANFVQCGENTQDCYNLLKDEVIYIHIKDAITTSNQNVLCGTGEGRIPEILSQLIESGYKGFLTLEPHLVQFDSLKDLELEDAAMVIENNKGLDGKSGYKLQYEALLKILEKIDNEER